VERGLVRQEEFEPEQDRDRGARRVAVRELGQ
jgi:hypothetical protein